MDFSVLAPLPPWGAGQIEFDSDIALKKQSAQSLTDLLSWPSDDVKQVLQSTSYWIRHDFSAISENSQETNRALGFIGNGALACQLVTPVGGDALVVLVQRAGEESIPRMVVHGNRYATTRAARMAFAYPNGAMNILSTVFRGVLLAFNNGPVRLINALNLFRLGLQIAEVHIQLLLWATALDGLTMAAVPAVFEKRLCNFLGAEAYVYPDLPPFERPSYRVKDVSGALFSLRSDIAHGREIKEQFWKLKPMIYGETQEFRHVLNDAALFLLCKFFRRVFLEDLVETLGDTKEWRALLQKESA